ncbi:hypothetical protein ACXWRS_10675, partial [Streptococcus pyogenes]
MPRAPLFLPPLFSPSLPFLPSLPPLSPSLPSSFLFSFSPFPFFFPFLLSPSLLFPLSPFPLLFLPFFFLFPFS